MDRANSFASQRVAWHAAQTSAAPSPREPQVRETKGEAKGHPGAQGGRVVVVVDPARVVRTTEAAQTDDGEAAREIRRSLAQLRRLLTVTTRAYEIDHRCCEDIPTCRERAPRCLIPAGGVAMICASGFTPYWPALLGAGVPLVCLGAGYAGAAPCTAGEGLERVRLCFKIDAERRDDLIEVPDVERRIAGLEAAERTLRPNAIAFEVRVASQLPADLASIVGEYADVNPVPAPQEAAHSRTMSPPRAQSMG